MQISVFPVFLSDLSGTSQHWAIYEGKIENWREKKKKNTTNKRTCNLKFGLVFWQPLTTHPPKWHWSISLGHENMSLNSRYEISIYSFWWLSKDIWTFPLLWSNKKKTPHKKPLTSLTIQFYIKHRELKLYLLFPRLLFLLF